MLWHASKKACFSQKSIKGGGEEAYKWMSRSLLIQPNSEMMEMLSGRAVTNQSHSESRMTVKDISGLSSFALVRRCRAVTTNSHAAPFTQWKLFAQTVFHPITIVPLSSSLFCHHLVMCCLAVEKDADGADGSGQVAACCRSLWSDS